MLDILTGINVINIPKIIKIVIELAQSKNEKENAKFYQFPGSKM
jgi:hypothetical protein